VLRLLVLQPILVPTPVRLFDPFNVTQVGPNLYQRAEVPNAIIPNPNPYALKLLSYYPDANRAPNRCLQLQQLLPARASEILKGHRKRAD
jgi:hypothetical protein